MVTQHTALYDELTVRQNLRFAADLYGVEDRDERIAEVLELSACRTRAKDRAGSLSGGMQRRLALGRALLHDPELLILDEPTLGVDVEARHALWGHVRWLRAHRQDASCSARTTSTRPRRSATGSSSCATAGR